MDNKENRKKVSNTKSGSKGGKSTGTKKNVTKKNSSSNTVKKNNNSVKNNNVKDNAKSKPMVKELDVKKIELENVEPSISNDAVKIEKRDVVKEDHHDVDKNVVNKVSRVDDKSFTNKVDFAICLIVGIVFVPIFIGALVSIVFIPAALIMFALELFCICYHYVDNPKKKSLVYTLFTIGVILVIGAIMYTVIKTR